MQNFISDNNASAHPEVLSYLSHLSLEHQHAYAGDNITKQATMLFKKHFGEDLQVFFTQTGSASNLLALGSVTESHQAVICADSAHVNKDECGAIERLLGIKLLPISAKEGKITPSQVDAIVQEHAMVHRVQPRVVSITQCSEWGTVYSIAEIRALSSYCHQHNLLLHMDGARLANAVVALNSSFRAVTVDSGVDILSFGGTKNGLMNAEAVIFFGNTVADKTPYLHKQLLQLTSKMRYISGQFIPLLSNDLWKKNAKHANEMAALLAEKLKNSIEIVMPVQTNAVFAKVPKCIIQPLMRSHEFAIWDNQESIIRLMTAFNTTEETIQAFADNMFKISFS